MIHADPILFTVRAYEVGMSYEGRNPYQAVATLIICGDLAYLCAMHGEMNREHWLNLQALLRRKGVIDLLTIRHGSRVWYAEEGGRMRIYRNVRFPVLPQQEEPGGRETGVFTGGEQIG